MKYAIRPMEEKDIPSVIAGEEKIFGTSLGYDMLYGDLNLNPYANYFVLDINGEVRGYIGLWITYEVADVINFYVDEAYQGAGFGSLILQFVVELCELSGVEKISLEVRVNNEKAIALYKKFGFVLSHVRKEYYSDKTDAYVLIKKVGEE